jgi:hypothetical protein
VRVKVDPGHGARYVATRRSMGASQSPDIRLNR